MVFLDTPGIHKAKGKMEKGMVQTAMNSLAEADVVVMVVDVQNPFLKGDKYIVNNLPKPAVLVINKIDMIKKHEILEIIELAREFGDKFSDILPVSAKESDGTEELIDVLKSKLHDSIQYFPEDIYTDQPERFLVAEIIREKIFNLTREEIPYKTAVFVDEFKENEKKNIIRISATIFVEKKNHKGIIIGSEGGLLKKVGYQSRVEIEKILGTKIFMELWVKVREKWSENESLVRDMGYLN